MLRGLVALALTTVSAGAGCNASPSPAPARGEAAPAASPGPEREADVEQVRACFDRFLVALERFDKPAVLAELTGAADELRAAGMFLDYLVAGHAFEQAFRGAHDDAAWAAFNDPEGASVQVAMPVDRSALVDAEVSIDKDRALLAYSGTDVGPSFRKVDGAWKLEVSSVFPPDEDGTRRVAFARMADVLIEARPRAADPATDPQQLDLELGQALERALTGE